MTEEVKEKGAEETPKEEVKETQPKPEAPKEKAKKRAPKEDAPKEEAKEIPKKVASILKSVSDLVPEERKVLGVEMVKRLTVLELSDWVKSMEETFGVTAAAPAAMAPVPGASGFAAGAAPEEEQTEFTAVLTMIGDKKIQVIKEVRALTNLGLKEAKELVDNAPKPIKENVPKEEAEEIKKKIEAVGGTVEIK